MFSSNKWIKITLKMPRLSSVYALDMISTQNKTQESSKFNYVNEEKERVSPVYKLSIKIFICKGK